MDKVKSICFIAFIIIMLGGCTLLNDTDANPSPDITISPTSTPKPTPTPIPTKTPIQREEEYLDAVARGYKPTLAPTEPSREDRIASYLTALKTTLDLNYKDTYSYKQEDNMITVNIWHDGLAEAAVYARAGYTDVQADWKQMTEDVGTFAKSLYEGFSDVELTDMHVLLNVLNDKAKENTLLSYLDGILFYDATK